MTMTYEVPGGLPQIRQMTGNGNPDAQQGAAEVTTPVMVQPQKAQAAQVIEAVGTVVDRVAPSTAALGSTDQKTMNWAQFGAVGLVMLGCTFFVWTGRTDQQARDARSEELVNKLMNQATLERMEQTSNFKDLMHSNNQAMGKVEQALKSVDASVERLRTDQQRVTSELVAATKQVTEEIRKTKPTMP